MYMEKKHTSISQQDDLFVLSQQIFSYVGTGLPGFDQYNHGLISLAQRHNAVTAVKLEALT